jgi:uncharacterized protein YndB with AHSA1/START domain
MIVESREKHHYEETWKRAPMTVTQLPSTFDRLLVEADFLLVSPHTLFDYWTQPTLLQQWWPQEAECVPHVGGIYHLSWPQMNWHLRGHYTSFDPGKRLGFTWKWDSDAQEPGEREVTLDFELLVPDGTRLLLTHGFYLDTPEDQDLRIEHHLAGWKHFLSRLQQLLGAS